MRFIIVMSVTTLLAPACGVGAYTFWHFVVVGNRPEDAPWGDYVSPVVGIGAFLICSVCVPLLYFYWINRRK
jgi:hypothetical protein